MEKLIVTLNVTDLRNIISEVIQTKLELLKEVGSTLNNSKTPELITRKEVAQIFGVSLVSIDKWRKHGILPKTIKQSGRTYFLRKEIIEFITTKSNPTK
ncbi:helix-turn-helix domain-containing protein [Flavobacteriales bacterium]|jgi:predicted site-specific integrase-resolvase|nr:helix-turn-helix domain-containing protein [Flavobacteriales bacterium]|tara:strand:- start:2913 stop:3209 length:297 start_codon:yes stop_codon:yes gene_type:complete